MCNAETFLEAYMASYPKPDGQKVTRHAPRFNWTQLPASGRVGDPPALPSWRDWTDGTRAWWANLWTKPQATQWDQDGSTLWTLAVLHDDLVLRHRSASSLAAEMRQHEDRHGLSPKAMLQLRWMVSDDARHASPPPSPADDRRTRLHIV